MDIYFVDLLYHILICSLCNYYQHATVFFYLLHIVCKAWWLELLLYIFFVSYEAVEDELLYDVLSIV